MNKLLQNNYIQHNNLIISLPADVIMHGIVYCLSSDNFLSYTYYTF